MKNGQRRWTREELILTIDLYCKLPFGQMYSRNPEVVELASLIQRTPGAVAYKLVNFASLDASLQARGIKGAANTSHLDKEIWKEFSEDWEGLFLESEKLRIHFESFQPSEHQEVAEAGITHQGKVRKQMVSVRVNQSTFRRIILASYNSTCCITGLNDSRLLVASHIRPWASDEGNRLNPRNGIALNGLHDKAFENGLITITPDYQIAVAGELKKGAGQQIEEYFLRYEGKEIFLPSKFLPDPDFLKYHNNERFKG